MGHPEGIRVIWITFWANFGKLLLRNVAAPAGTLRDLHSFAIARVMNQVHLTATRPSASLRAMKVPLVSRRVGVLCLPFEGTLPPPQIRMATQ